MSYTFHRNNASLQFFSKVSFVPNHWVASFVHQKFPRIQMSSLIVHGTPGVFGVPEVLRSPPESHGVPRSPIESRGVPESHGVPRSPGVPWSPAESRSPMEPRGVPESHGVPRSPGVPWSPAESRSPLFPPCEQRYFHFPTQGEGYDPRKQLETIVYAELRAVKRV
jgi:hypothetical protein